MGLPHDLQAASFEHASGTMTEPRPFLTAAWRYLAMLNFEVPPALLGPLVPVGIELVVSRFLGLDGHRKVR